MTDLPEDDVGWILRRSAEHAPITKTLGMEPLSYDRESGIFRMAFDAKPEFSNILGTIQGGILTAMLGMVWSIVTIFVVPAMVYDDIGPIDAIRRSAETTETIAGGST